MKSIRRWIRLAALAPALLLAVLHTGCQQTGGPSNYSANPYAGMGGQTDPFTGMAMRPNSMPGGVAPYGPGSSGLVQTQYMAPHDGSVVTGPQGTGPGLIKPGVNSPYVRPLEGASSVMLMPPGGDMHPEYMPGGCGNNNSPPTELNPVSMPLYTVAPPDILTIDAPQLFPRSYQIQPFDVLGILLISPSAPVVGEDPATRAKKDILLSGDFKVTPEGKILLPILGSPTAIQVAGMTVEQATQALHERLTKALKNVDVFIELKQFRPIAQFQKADYLVRPDGTISLGTYGFVYVAGLTLPQIKTEVEKHLSQYLSNPVISVDVRSYNSKKYYLVIDGGGYGQLVFAYPHTGYETVLDAVSRLQGLPWWASKKKIWVARPAPCCNPCYQILPVDWNAITQAGNTCTNWQLMPGDRIYVRADCLVEVNNWISKVLSPINQVLNSTLLGVSVYDTIRNSNGNNSGTALILH